MRDALRPMESWANSVWLLHFNRGVAGTGELQCGRIYLRRNKPIVSAVIFDIDGTLIDSVDLHAEAWRVALERFGKKTSFAEIRRQIGKGGDQLMPVFLSQEELAKFAEPLNQVRSEVFKREFLPRVKAFPAVRQLFQRIRKDNKRIALASSAKGDELKTYKTIAGIDDLVEADALSHCRAYHPQGSAVPASESPNASGRSYRWRKLPEPPLASRAVLMRPTLPP